MSYLDDYKNNKSSERENEAYDYLVTSLMVDKTMGAEKTNTIYGMNMEKKLQGKILPSMFYIFQYAPPVPEKMGNKTFIDSVPLILCTGVSERTVSGLNFNMIPNDVRAMILDVIHDGYKDFYDKKIQSMTDAGINEEFASILVNNDTFEKFMTLVSSKCSIDLRKACRTYNKAYMSGIRMIEYDQWGQIPNLSFKDALRGMSLAEMQIAMAKANR